MDLATQKLLVDSGDDSGLDHQKCLSISLLSIRFHLSSTAIITNETLIKRLMATCDSISSYRTVIKSWYPSEPILADVAMVYMRKYEDFLNLMQDLRNMLQHDILTSSSGKGEVGELIASTMLY